MNGLLVVHNMKAVQNVAIIGAGNMGSGIAQKSARRFNVQMVDREAQYVARGRSIIENFLQKQSNDVFSHKMKWMQHWANHGCGGY